MMFGQSIIMMSALSPVTCDSSCTGNCVIISNLSVWVNFYFVAMFFYLASNAV